MNNHIPLTLEQIRPLPPNKQGFALLNTPKRNQEKILSQFSTKEVVALLGFLDPSQAKSLLERIKNKKTQTEIISDLNEDMQNQIEFLFGFAPNTAGGIMDINYIEVEKSESLEKVKKRMTVHEKKTAKIPTVLVVEDGILQGEIPPHKFIFPPQNQEKNLEQYIVPLPTIHHAKNSHEVLEVLKQHTHSKIAVLNDDQSILGIIYSDDIIRLFQKESSTGLYDFAGVHDEEDVFDSSLTKVEHRYKWLIINLATAYLAAYIVSLFESTLSQFVILAAYMPIVAGMGGNAGTQTLAVMVRSIALGEIEMRTCGKALLNEALAGGMNGLINGLIVAVVAIFWNHNPILGVVTGTAMIINLIVAGFFGALIPLVMKRLGKDPATSATIFITTATDVFGFLTFLGLATLLLK